MTMFFGWENTVEFNIFMKNSFHWTKVNWLVQRADMNAQSVTIHYFIYFIYSYKNITQKRELGSCGISLVSTVGQWFQPLVFEGIWVDLSEQQAITNNKTQIPSEAHATK